MCRLAFIAQSLVVVLLALFASGCGGSDPSGSERSATTATGGGIAATTGAGEGDGASVRAALTVRMTQMGERQGAGVPLPKGARCTRSIPATCTVEVTCPAATAGQQRASERCAWLAGAGRELLTEEPSSGMACTQQYGGPEQAHVSGTLEDDEVDARFSREDGCAIARWEAAAVLWDGDVDGDDAGGGGARPTREPEPRVISVPAPPTQPDASVSSPRNADE